MNIKGKISKLKNIDREALVDSLYISIILILLITMFFIVISQEDSIAEKFIEEGQFEYKNVIYQVRPIKEKSWIDIKSGTELDEKNSEIRD